MIIVWVLRIAFDICGNLSLFLAGFLLLNMVLVKRLSSVQRVRYTGCNTLFVCKIMKER